MLKIHIEVDRSEVKVYDYEVPYSEFCYAVAKACTDMLKKYGFYGYHYSTYTQDLNVRQLLFLKSVALGSFKARELIELGEKEHGEAADFGAELELLLFDM